MKEIKNKLYSVPVQSDVNVYTFGDRQKYDKSFLLTAGIHGEEATSIVVARDVISCLKRIDEKHLKGTIKVVPVCNPESYRYKGRSSPSDSKDLNRVFPGDSQGKITEKIAASIWELALESDYVLDLHSCGRNMDIHPYILTLYENKPGMELAGKIPHQTVVHSNGTKGQLFKEALNHEIPAAIVEMASGGGRGLVDLEDRRYFGRRVIETLENLGFLEGIGNEVEQELLGKLECHKVESEGLFVPKTRPGARVKEGQRIGVINGKPIFSLTTGKVIRISQSSIRFPGETVARIAPSQNYKA